MQLSELDESDHRAFEYAIRDLMRRDGFTAERVGGAGDDACDVRAVDADAGSGPSSASTGAMAGLGKPRGSV